MKIIFNDATELQVQSVTEDSGQLLIKTIAATTEVLRAKFSDTFATKQMSVQERGKTIAIYKDYTELYRLEEYAGSIRGVVMYQAQKTPEAQAEVVAASVMVAQMQAQLLTDEEALTVKAIYPAWDGNGISYATGFKVLSADILYKCLQDHVSQQDWTPETAPSLWAKVLIPDASVIQEWEQPDSTNGYSIGDKVTRNGVTYESLVDNNVWEPGTTGTELLWKVVTETE